MALAGCESAKSVVALSNSPVFHHQYSSVSAAISGLAHDERERRRVGGLFKQLWLKHFPSASVNHFQTDVVNIFREHSPCLKDRQYVHKANNVIGGNKPIGIGYPLSSVNRADLASSWSLPFELRRVTSSEDGIEVGAGQIRAICEREEFAGSLNINAADSGYGVAKYISKVHSIENLVNVLRLRHGNKVWEADERETGGAPQIYGAKYYLTEKSGSKIYRHKEKTYQVEQISIYEKEASQEKEIGKRTRGGRELRIELKRWERMKMRTKDGNSMKEVEFDLVRMRMLDAKTGERVFNNDVFAAVVGKERGRLSLEEAAEEFYHRFDLEATNRFMKQNLFLEGYQTPSAEHLDNWNLLVQMAMWLLWAGSKEVEKVCEKWQKYSEPKQEKGGRLTAAQTRKGLERLISSFEKERYLPKKCKKGSGRRSGEKQAKREKYRVAKKGNPEASWKKTIELRE